MSEFSQNGIISTLHDFGTRSTAEIEKDLLKFSKERKMELILPCLYSELEVLHRNVYSKRHSTICCSSRL